MQTPMETPMETALETAMWTKCLASKVLKCCVYKDVLNPQ
jgi:hypothetical protein